MRRKTLLTSYAAALAIVFGFVTMASLLRAGSKNAPSRFNNESGEDGAVPYAGVIFDGAGNLYGATTSDGAYGGGTIFQLVPKNDTWTENILYSFCRVHGCPDGVGPSSALIFDGSGNLYGTSPIGGPHNAGAVFRLAPKNGTWTETVLHGFDRKDGDGPVGSVIFDAAGNLYGTTIQGGAYGKQCGGAGCGTVFELTPGGRTSNFWTETVLHNFNNNGKDGYWPQAGLVFDASGNLYGTTYYGGDGSCNDGRGIGCGAVFELTPGANGAWTETILHSFNRKDGYNPAASLVFDAVGNLYGVTQHGGALGKGTVFQLSRSAGGTWTETLLHSFQNDGKDGNFPKGSLIFDMDGNLYGTTLEGPGDTCHGFLCGGTVFQLVHSTDGRWKEKVLHGFSGPDGLDPVAGPIFGADGALYSTTAYGGNVKQCSGNGCGTVFRLAPGTNGNWAEKVLHKFSFD